MEQVELVEAWAWLRADKGLPEWDEQFGHAARQRMEYLFFGYMRWKYTHVEPRWYKYALWSAWVYKGEPAEGLVNKAGTEIRSKFNRDEWTKNPINNRLVDDVVANMPPFEPPFDDARRLTKALQMVQEDDWRLILWFKLRGMPLLPSDIHDFRPDLNTRKISARINHEMKEHHNV